MTTNTTALLLAALFTGCGGVAVPVTDDAVADAAPADAEIPMDVVTDVVLVPDASDAEMDSDLSDSGEDTSVTPDSSTPDSSTPDDAGMPDTSVPDASTPSAYRVEIYGFSVPSMRRRVQAAAPGYTNWQTHDPQAGVVAQRSADVVFEMNVSAQSAVFNNTHSASSATTAMLVSEDLEFSELATVVVGFADFEQNGDFTPAPMPYEPMGSCAAGWMTPAAIANALATGNIQTTSCPAPTHPVTGTVMFNADFVVEWRVVAVP